MFLECLTTGGTLPKIPREDVYRFGWDAATELLWPRIVGLSKALEEISKHYVDFELTGIDYEEQIAIKAFKVLKEFGVSSRV